MYKRTFITYLHYRDDKQNIYGGKKNKYISKIVNFSRSSAAAGGDSIPLRFMRYGWTKLKYFHVSYTYIWCSSKMSYEKPYKRHETMG